MSGNSTSHPALSVENVTFSYGDRRALDKVSFQVQPGEIFGLLGPNGGGKTTLFRLLTTLLPLQQGTIQLCGCNVASSAADVRRRLGITFQSPSLDGKLTVLENLLHQGHLYGLRGSSLRQRIEQVAERLGVADRLSQAAETLSGGLKRRVEIAKSLLHGPRMLILDEPSTGLDPGARLDLWKVLSGSSRDEGITILVTTHLMDEAERCDRLGILDRGCLVAEGSPSELRKSLGGNALTIVANEPGQLAERIQQDFGIASRLIGDELRVGHPHPLELLQKLASAYHDDISAISVAKPTLEDVFIDRTGHRFWDSTAAD